MFRISPAAPPPPFADGSPLTRLRRRCRNLLLLAAAAAALVEWKGIPHLRTTYRYRGTFSHRQIESANYWSPVGTLTVNGDGPLVLFAKPDPPLYRRALDAAAALLTTKEHSQ